MTKEWRSIAHSFRAHGPHRASALVSPEGTSHRDNFMQSTMRRVRQACTNCRDRHIRCDGMHPCYSCELRGITCLFKRRPEQPQQLFNQSAPTLPSYRAPYMNLVGAASHVLNAPHANMPRTFSDVVLTMYKDEVAQTSMKSSLSYDSAIAYEVWRLLTEGSFDFNVLSYTQLAEGLVYGVLGSRALKDDQRTAMFARKAEEFAFELVNRRRVHPNITADDGNSAVPILEAMMQLFAFYYGNGNAERGRLVAILGSQFIESAKVAIPAELRFKASVAMFSTSTPEQEAAWLTNVVANVPHVIPLARVDAALMLTSPLVEGQSLPLLSSGGSAVQGVNESVAEYLRSTGETIQRPEIPTDRRILYEAVVAGARAVHFAKLEQRNLAYEMVKTCLDFARTMDLSMPIYQSVAHAVVLCVHVALELGFTAEAVRGLALFRPFLAVLKPHILHLVQRLQQTAQAKGIHAIVVKQEGDEATSVAPLGYGADYGANFPPSFPPAPTPSFHFDEPDWTRNAANMNGQAQNGQLQRRAHSMPVQDSWQPSDSGSDSPLEGIMVDAHATHGDHADVDHFLQ